MNGAILNKKYLIMSKEQTPITAKDILAKEFEDYIHLDGFEIESIFESMEQYAQAKVLEALERVEEKISLNESMSDYAIGTEELRVFIETEVKPKYKQINK